MLIAALVVADHTALDTLLGDVEVKVDRAVGVGAGGLDGEFEGVEGGASVAAGDKGEVFESLVGDGDLAVAVAAFGVGEGALEEDEGLLVAEGFEAEQPQPGQ